MWKLSVQHAGDKSWSVIVEEADLDLEFDVEKTVIEYLRSISTFVDER